MNLLKIVMENGAYSPLQHNIFHDLLFQRIPKACMWRKGLNLAGISELTNTYQSLTVIRKSLEQPRLAGVKQVGTEQFKPFSPQPAPV